MVLASLSSYTYIFVSGGVGNPFLTFCDDHGTLGTIGSDNTPTVSLRQASKLNRSMLVCAPKLAIWSGIVIRKNPIREADELHFSFREKKMCPC